ncbi:MAG: hypothetical protein FJ042_05710 [Candidatus Cloacimonetes bacterium]|nr:hypothetical protein [Candidatus Cloacimonadota bacterium]
MMNLMHNQRGNLAVALALAILGIMSGLTMSVLAMRDTVGFNYDYEGVQSLHFLRSEGKRAQTLVEKMDYSGGGFSAPDKYAEVSGSHLKRTFHLRTKIERDNVTTGGGMFFTGGYAIRSLVTSAKGIGGSAQWTQDRSIVKKYGIHYIRRTSFAGYHYFTDTDQSVNSTPVYFWGPDVIYGKVHSNSDIWLKQLGGGQNGGWPTFYGKVTTAGAIQSFSGQPPYAQIFRGGYMEHVNPIEFNPQATLIINNGQPFAGGAHLPNSIFLVTVGGSQYTSYRGDMSDNIREYATVWTNYPPGVDSLYRNNYTVRDTVWSTGPGGALSNQSIYVKSNLWIRGTFSGKQTWCSKYNMMLNRDIIYSGTAAGAAPDNPDNMNLNDFTGLVSERSILIQYGYRDPIDSMRYRPNCQPTAGTSPGIMIYAAMCALGPQGDPTPENPSGAGVFSFEYQRPHSSVPAYRLGNVIYDKIDLHRRRYPQTTAQLWPQNIDYPWYNPLWPERIPMNERGTITLYGSVAQRRRGFVHRSNYDTEHQPAIYGLWDIPAGYLGGPPNTAYNDPVLPIVLSTTNAPGATGAGVGYSEKNYHFDERLSFAQPPDFPEVHVRGGLTPFESENWTLRHVPRTF